MQQMQLPCRRPALRVLLVAGMVALLFMVGDAVAEFTYRPQ